MQRANPFDIDKLKLGKKENGGSDETRTRDLWRDRLAL